MYPASQLNSQFQIDIVLDVLLDISNRF